MQSEAPTVDAYLEEQPEGRRRTLRLLREMIRAAAPEAEELMKYKLPHWDWNGPLFALAAQKNYFSLYVSEPDLVEAAKPRLAPLDVGKSCIRFRKVEQLPLDVIAKLLEDAADRRRATEG
ncbi:MAG: DUF1801 domain-containing protein [Acidobacteria bacterium]|nr:DUF1801 domain-containing protein [Acidobacteriota bacterium]